MKEEFPIIFGIEHNDCVLIIGGRRIGFLKSIKFEADAETGLDIQIKRFRDAPEHCWESSFDEILDLHIANCKMEIVDR